MADRRKPYLSAGLLDLDGDGEPDVVMPSSLPAGRTGYLSDAARRRATGAAGAAGTDPNAPGASALDAALFAFGGPAGRALGSAARAAPAVAGGLLGLGALASPSEAQAPSRRRGQQVTPASDAEARRNGDPLWHQVKDDPALSAIYMQMEDAKARSTAAIRGVNAASSDAARQRASEEANKLQQQLITELQRRNPPQMPFEKAYPWMAQNLPLVQAGAGLATGALLKTGGNIASRIDAAPWNKAVRQGDVATAREFLKAHDGLLPTAGRVAKEASPVLGAGVVGMEAALFPHQYNRRNAPEGSPERLAAEKALGTPQDMLTTAMGGFIPAALGGYTGAHIPLGIPAARPPVAQTRAMLAADDIANSGTKPSMTGPMGTGSRPVPPPPEPSADPVTYRRYADIPPEMRADIRDQYRGAVVDAGAPLNPRESAQIIKQHYANQGVNIPSTAGRIETTNRAVQKFFDEHGRLPASRNEWAQWIYRNTGTLAVPAAVGLGAGSGLLDGLPPPAPPGYGGLLDLYRGGS